MDHNRDIDSKKGERMSFFEKMAMIEPKIEVKAKKKKRTYGNETEPPKDKTVYEMANKVKQKLLLDRLSSLSPSNSPRSQSRSPSPTTRTAPTDHLSESSSSVATTDSGLSLKSSDVKESSTLEAIVADQLNKAPNSAHTLKPESKPIKSCVSSKHSTNLKTEIVNELCETIGATKELKKSSSKLNPQSTSISNGSQAHISIMERAQVELSSSQRSDTASCTISQEENLELRKTPIVCLEIMQKETIDKHLSSSSSPRSAEKKPDLSSSRTKVKEIAKSSPRSSPKLVKKPFRRSSIKSVSDSQVESILPTKGVKTPTKSSAVSPIKSETTPPKTTEDSEKNSDENRSITKKPTLKIAQSDTHSSIDQEIVQIIPRFGADAETETGDQLKTTDQCCSDNNVAEDAKSVDSVEMCSSISQLSCSLASTEPASNSTSVCDTTEQVGEETYATNKDNRLPESNHQSQNKSENNVSLGSTISDKNDTVQNMCKIGVVSIQKSDNLGQSGTKEVTKDTNNMKSGTKDTAKSKQENKKELVSSKVSKDQKRLKRKGDDEKGFTSRSKLSAVRRRRLPNGSPPTISPLVPGKNTKRSSRALAAKRPSMNNKGKDSGVELISQEKGSAIKGQGTQEPHSPRKIRTPKIQDRGNPTPPSQKGTVALTLQKVRRSKSPKAKCPSSEVGNNDDTEIK